jgi:DNA-binding MarR family transcriptional regulator
MKAAKSKNAYDLRHKGDEPHLLREIVRTHQVLMNAFSRKVGMPASQFALMRLLAVSGEELGVMEIARRLGVNPAAITRQVQVMEKDGLLRRRADPRDGRRSSVRLSPKGFKLFEAMHERTHELESNLSAIISPDEMKAAAEVLTKLREFVENL